MARWVGSADNSHRQILILGHVDTVWPIGELARRPTRREDGCFFGPGAFDMKAGLIMATHAMRLLVERDPRLSCDVVFIVSGDEEVGSLTCRSLIEEQARKSMAVLVVEPPARDGHLTVARKGVGRYTIRVEGKATHAGRSHAEGVNAIEELARQVLHLQSLTDYAQGATVNVGVFRGGMRPNVVPARGAGRTGSASSGGIRRRAIGSRHQGTGMSRSAGATRSEWRVDQAPPGRRPPRISRSSSARNLSLPDSVWRWPRSLRVVEAMAISRRR